MKKRTIYIGLFLIFIIGLISLIGTFAIGSVITEGNSSKADYLFNITLGDRTSREIVIPSYDSKIVDIKISNPNEFNMSYLLYLEGVDSNISIINISNTESSGILNSKNNTLIKVFIQNNSSSNITTSIKDIVGFENEKLSVPSNNTSINKGTYYKVIVKSNNNDYGKVKPNIKLSTSGGTVKYTIVPNTGYQYKSTTCNGTVSNDILTVSNITSNTTCEVVFESKEITVNFDLAGGVVETTYTEPQEHTYTVPYTGTYKIELWGAQGGSSLLDGGTRDVSASKNCVADGTGKCQGGYGSYTSGTIDLVSNEKLYFYVGGKGLTGVVSQNVAGGYNGGGIGTWDNNDNESDGSGGGATDVRLVSGDWNNITSLASRIMVAAGGGGASDVGSGLAGGGLTNTNQTITNYTAKKFTEVNQVSGYKFGVGQDGVIVRKNYPISGAGGGYYGGYALDNNSDYYNFGEGGSSYISGHTGAVAVISEDDINSKSGCTTGTTDNSCSIHYSGKNFSNTVMIDGLGYTWTNVKSELQQMPNPTGGYYANGAGNIGDGAAKITLTNNFSKMMTYNTEYGNLPTPVKSDYIFKGWYTGENGTGTKITEDTVLSNANNHTLYAYWIKSTLVLYDYIKNNADTTTQIDFSQTSEQSNTNGIYMTTDTDSGNPVYYYRGAVDNNVLFANFCWKIIRTTETGGVKLIYNGVPSDGQCNNAGADSTIGNYNFNSSNDSPVYAGYMYNAVYTATSKSMSSATGTLIFGNDIDYNASTNKYTLKDTYTLTDASNWSRDYTTIASKYHYTCLTSDNTCTSVYYIYNMGFYYIWYFTLTNGKNHLDILEEMLNSDDINTKDSTIKTALDTWYQNNMTSHTSKLEDTVFCNDRGYDVSKSGWNKDYSAISGEFCFNSYSRLSSYKPSLVCSRQIDKFTTNSNNGNGKLTYPVGLITADESAFAGGRYGSSNSSYYLYNNADQWALSPRSFMTIDVRVLGLYSYGGGLASIEVTWSYGARPVVSLKSGATVTGSGTATNPFVVE